MPSASHPKPPQVKVDANPGRLRGQSLRPIVNLLPDVSAPAFRLEAHRQSLAVAAGARARKDQAFIDNVSDWGVDASNESLDPSSSASHQ
ncbi:MAG TPA: antitoxin MazE family protein [Candidatus Baltobacteraceae bacterium]|jgi:hypothetical protein|nr:antitoxin MazE family protein [Candidatus Baltobacteraceae bacterium]